MSLNLENYEELTKRAVTHFWQSRKLAKEKQEASGKSDQGERSAVTAGNNMEGFIHLFKTIVTDNGLPAQNVFVKRGSVSLPGFYRPTKQWDLLIVYQSHLIAALEIKSQVGSFGNNFNNRCEEALGTAIDLWTAFQEGVFGDWRPFVGYFMLLQDCAEVHRPVQENSPHFAILPEFKDASYAQRYELLCKKLTLERLYDAAALLLSPDDTGLQGTYSELSAMSGLRVLIAGLAAHVAKVAAIQ
jgi:Restriction endonuclease XhoI